MFTSHSFVYSAPEELSIHNYHYSKLRILEIRLNNETAQVAVSIHITDAQRADAIAKLEAAIVALKAA